MSTRPHTRRSALCALASSLAATAWPARSETGGARTAYAVSIVPQFQAAELHRDWSPLLDRVGKEVGVTLVLKLQPNIPRFEADLLAGQPDFAFMNPYHQVMARRAQGYVPLVRDTKLLSGILLVRKDSPVASVRELDGMDLAFPAPNSFGASLWLRALLTERERIRFNPVYVQTHANVYRQVIRGKALAGGGVNITLQQEDEAVRNELRVLLETPGVPPHPFAAHPRVPARLQQAVAESLLRMNQDTAGQALLKQVIAATLVRADHASDYRPLEQYRLEKYVVEQAG